MYNQIYLFCILCVFLIIIEDLTCRDEWPRTWNNKAMFRTAKVTADCLSVNCPNVIESGSAFCLQEISNTLSPLFDCAGNATGLVQDYCKKTCNNCGR